MEIQFQQQNQYIANNKKIAKKSKKRVARKSNNKFVGVRQRPSGRWVAEIKDTTQKIRMWLGTFERAEDAAMAYDEAARLLRGSHARTNFAPVLSHDDDHHSPIASRIRNLLTDKKGQGQAKPGPGQGKNKIVDTLRVNSDDAYRPDITGFDQPGSSSSSQPDYSWCFSIAGNGSGNGNEEGVEVSDESELLEFERMRVERQISASLYAMNGVQEYMETVHDPVEDFWDLPPLTSLLF